MAHERALHTGRGGRCIPGTLCCWTPSPPVALKHTFFFSTPFERRVTRWSGATSEARAEATKQQHG
eukprot:13709201-Alexandrium_andersonii.AAC.1